MRDRVLWQKYVYCMNVKSVENYFDIQKVYEHLNIIFCM